MDIEDFKQIVHNEIGENAVIDMDSNATPMALIIEKSYIHAVCKLLKENEKCYFDLLSCITAIDNGVEKQSMEVVYNLTSIPLEHSLMLKIVLDRSKPSILSVTDVWNAANWHEREAYDLFGVVFVNHPDMRRILMPADWEGYPMRKDYEEPEQYRGMKTVREEEKEA